MSDNTQVEQLIRDCAKRSTLPHMNILIAGRTGVGKGTLINAVFQGDYVTTGQGKPVTRNTKEYTKKGVPLTIFDTRGLELADYTETFRSLEQLIEERQKDVDPNRHIHVAWICIQEPGRRVEEAEIELQNLLERAGIPIVGVITKAMSDQGFKAEVQNLLPKTKNIVRVNSLETVLDGGHLVQAYGVEKLVQCTMEFIDEGQRQALVSSQHVLIQEKITESLGIIQTSQNISEGIAFRAGILQDVGLLVPILIAMITTINYKFGYFSIDISKNKDDGTALLFHASKKILSTIKFRFILLGICKAIPFLGYLFSYFSSRKASHYTAALGYAYLDTILELQKDPSLEHVVLQRFDQRFMDNLKRKESVLRDERIEMIR